MFCCRFDATYDGVVSPVEICAGGLVVPKRTSYDVASVADHDIATEVADTPVDPVDGDGDPGVDGGGGVRVVNDQTGPAFSPRSFLAITCQ